MNTQTEKKDRKYPILLREYNHGGCIMKCTQQQLKKHVEENNKFIMIRHKFRSQELESYIHINKHILESGFYSNRIFKVSITNSYIVIQDMGWK